jgi:hypothetical protein
MDQLLLLALLFDQVVIHDGPANVSRCGRVAYLSINALLRPARRHAETQALLTCQPPD